MNTVHDPIHELKNASAAVNAQAELLMRCCQLLADYRQINSKLLGYVEQLQANQAKPADDSSSAIPAKAPKAS